MASEDKHGSARLRNPPDHDNSSVESSDKDLAAAIVSDHAGEFDRVTERRVLRKIDMYLIPWMWLGYGFVYYDKVREEEEDEEEEEQEEEEKGERCDLMHQ